ncbi:hypothetical protein EIY71_18350 [Pseudomonas sp. CH235]|nr:hypothetical protein EIY71_18350 [Pseudomonas sp. CH235]
MIVPTLIVPTLCVGMNTVTLCVTEDAERPWLHSHAERGNDQCSVRERSGKKIYLAATFSDLPS